mgnify:CR=1 FL=1
METDVKLKVEVVGQPGQPRLKERLDREPHDRSRPEDQHVAVGWPQDASRCCKGGGTQDAGTRTSRRRFLALDLRCPFVVRPLPVRSNTRR